MVKFCYLCCFWHCNTDANKHDLEDAYYEVSFFRYTTPVVVALIILCGLKALYELGLLILFACLGLPLLVILPAFWLFTPIIAFLAYKLADPKIYIVAFVILVILTFLDVFQFVWFFLALCTQGSALFPYMSRNLASSASANVLLSFVIIIEFFVAIHGIVNCIVAWRCIEYAQRQRKIEWVVTSRQHHRQHAEAAIETTHGTGLQTIESSRSTIENDADDDGSFDEEGLQNVPLGPRLEYYDIPPPLEAGTSVNSTTSEHLPLPHILHRDSISPVAMDEETKIAISKASSGGRIGRGVVGYGRGKGILSTTDRFSQKTASIDTSETDINVTVTDADSIDVLRVDPEFAAVPLGFAAPVGRYDHEGSTDRIESEKASKASLSGRGSIATGGRASLSDYYHDDPPSRSSVDHLAYDVPPATNDLEIESVKIGKGAEREEIKIGKSSLFGDSAIYEPLKLGLGIGGGAAAVASLEAQKVDKLNKNPEFSAYPLEDAVQFIPGGSSLPPGKVSAGSESSFTQQLWHGSTDKYGGGGLGQDDSIGNSVVEVGIGEGATTAATDLDRFSKTGEFESQPLENFVASIPEGSSISAVSRRPKEKAPDVPPHGKDAGHRGDGTLEKDIDFGVQHEAAQDIGWGAQVSSVGSGTAVYREEDGVKLYDDVIGEYSIGQGVQSTHVIGHGVEGDRTQSESIGWGAATTVTQPLTAHDIGQGVELAGDTSQSESIAEGAASTVTQPIIGTGVDTGYTTVETSIGDGGTAAPHEVGIGSGVASQQQSDHLSETVTEALVTSSLSHDTGLYAHHPTIGHGASRVDTFDESAIDNIQYTSGPAAGGIGSGVSPDYTYPILPKADELSHSSYTGTIHHGIGYGAIDETADGDADDENEASDDSLAGIEEIDEDRKSVTTINSIVSISEDQQHWTTQSRHAHEAAHAIGGGAVAENRLTSIGEGVVTESESSTTGTSLVDSVGSGARPDTITSTQVGSGAAGTTAQEIGSGASQLHKIDDYERLELHSAITGGHDAVSEAPNQKIGEGASQTVSQIGTGGQVSSTTTHGIGSGSQVEQSFSETSNIGSGASTVISHSRDPSIDTGTKIGEGGAFSVYREPAIGKATRQELNKESHTASNGSGHFSLSSQLAAESEAKIGAGTGSAPPLGIGKGFLSSYTATVDAPTEIGRGTTVYESRQPAVGSGARYDHGAVSYTTSGHLSLTSQLAAESEAKIGSGTGISHPRDTSIGAGTEISKIGGGTSVVESWESTETHHDSLIGTGGQVTHGSSSIGGGATAISHSRGPSIGSGTSQVSQAPQYPVRLATRRTSTSSEESLNSTDEEIIETFEIVDPNPYRYLESITEESNVGSSRGNSISESPSVPVVVTRHATTHHEVLTEEDTSITLSSGEEDDSDRRTPTPMPDVSRILRSVPEGVVLESKHGSDADSDVEAGPHPLHRYAHRETMMTILTSSDEDDSRNATPTPSSPQRYRSWYPIDARRSPSPENQGASRSIVVDLPLDPRESMFPPRSITTTPVPLPSPGPIEISFDDFPDTSIYERRLSSDSIVKSVLQSRNNPR